MQLSDRNFFALAVIFYGVSTLYAVFLQRRGFREDNRVNYCLLFCGAILHTVAMLKRGYALGRCPTTNLYEATVFVAWAMVAAYVLVGLWSRLRFLGAFASPVLFAIGIFALMPQLDVHGPQPKFTGGWSSLHKALLLLAYGAFGLSAVAGLMFLTQEYDLKHAKLRAVLSRLPPIQRLEITISRSLLAGFVLLTLGLAVGAFYLKQTQGVYLSGDAEVVYTLLVWGIYLALLVARWKFAQRGRRLAWGAIGSFVFLMLTFWGVYLLSPLHNPRKPPPTQTAWMPLALPRSGPVFVFPPASLLSRCACP